MTFEKVNKILNPLCIALCVAAATWQTIQNPQNSYIWWLYCIAITAHTISINTINKQKKTINQLQGFIAALTRKNTHENV